MLLVLLLAGLKTTYAVGIFPRCSRTAGATAGASTRARARAPSPTRLQQERKGDDEEEEEEEMERSPPRPKSVVVVKESVGEEQGSTLIMVTEVDSEIIHDC